MQYSPYYIGSNIRLLLDTDNDMFEFLKGFIEDWNDSTYEKQLIEWLEIRADTH